jgi:hypothetical protein
MLCLNIYFINVSLNMSVMSVIISARYTKIGVTHMAGSRLYLEPKNIEDGYCTCRLCKVLTIDGLAGVCRLLCNYSNIHSYISPNKLPLSSSSSVC